MSILLVVKLLFLGTIFTYGQSGSGKTYTLDALRTFAIKTIYEYIENVCISLSS